MSGARLWLTFYLKIRNNDGNITIPPSPYILKHAAHGVYNGRKQEVDKATELGQLILLSSSKLNFETKYILHVIDGVTCNAWRLFQTVKVCHPYIKV